MLGQISATVPSATGTVAFGQTSPTCEPASREAVAGAVRARVATNASKPMTKRQRIFDIPLPSSIPVPANGSRIIQTTPRDRNAEMKVLRLASPVVEPGGRPPCLPAAKCLGRHQRRTRRKEDKLVGPGRVGGPAVGHHHV